MVKSNRKRPASSQRKISAVAFPLLKKVAVALGKHVHIPGSFWDNCPAADTDKIFKCVVVEFVAVHDFGKGVKSDGFKVRALRAGLVAAVMQA